MGDLDSNFCSLKSHDDSKLVILSASQGCSGANVYPTTQSNLGEGRDKNR